MIRSMPGGPILKWTLIVLSTLAVLWFSNAPVGSPWSRDGESGGSLPALPPERVAAARTELYDGLVGAFNAEGETAWWYLEGDEVVFGFRVGEGPCACRVELRSPGGGLAPWRRLAGRDERWIPLWPCGGARRAAEAWLERIEAARVAVLENAVRPP